MTGIVLPFRPRSAPAIDKGQAAADAREELELVDALLAVGGGGLTLAEIDALRQRVARAVEAMSAWAEDATCAELGRALLYEALARVPRLEGKLDRAELALRPPAPVVRLLVPPRRARRRAAAK